MIAEIEDAVIERCRQMVGNHVRTIEDLPGKWDENTLRAARRQVPGIYVAWSGGSAESATRPLIRARLAVYVVTGHASGERARRRGNDRDMGAYELLEQLVPALHNFTIQGIGSLLLQSVDNLYSDSADRDGVMIHGASFEIKTMFPAPREIGELADFATFSATHDVGDGPDTESHLELPTGSKETP